MLINYIFYMFIIYVIYYNIKFYTGFCMYKSITTMKTIDLQSKIIIGNKWNTIWLNNTSKKNPIYFNKFYVTKNDLKNVYPASEEIIHKLYNIFIHPIVYTEFNDKFYIKTFTHSTKIKDNLEKNIFLSNIDLNNIYRDQYIDSSFIILDKNIFKNIIEKSLTDTKSLCNDYTIYEEYIPIIEKFLEFSIIENKHNNK